MFVSPAVPNLYKYETAWQTLKLPGGSLKIFNEQFIFYESPTFLLHRKEECLQYPV
jgi:hypothetical protein